MLLTPHMGYVDGDTMASWYQEEADIIEKWVRGDQLPNEIT